MNYLSKLIKGACLAGLSFLFSYCQSPDNTTSQPTGFEALKAFYIQNIDTIVADLNHLTKSKNTDEVYRYFVAAKNHFKLIEPILAYTDYNNHLTLNGPNLLKVEEEDATDIKKTAPHGFQVLEESLFVENSIDQQQLQLEVKFITARLQLIKTNIFFNRYQPYHFLWLLRNAVISAASLGITGFDSPVLGRSLAETQQLYTGLGVYLSYFKNSFQSEELYQKWQEEITTTIHTLDHDFDTFDRYHFIKNHTHPQLELWQATARDWQVNFPLELAIANNATNLFSSNTYNSRYFAGHNSLPLQPETVKLGRQLFYDVNLSGSGSMSCGTCHQPEQAFTDGRKKALGKNQQPLVRNTPTLLYAGLQKGFFYDKRAGNLEGQIVGVVDNENEFHSSLQSMTSTVRSNSDYVQQFAKLFPDTVTNLNIRQAIATYIRSLTPFDSKFDRNMRNEEQTLSKDEILGFNLFMGKAACATCHFAPLFNGTVPPQFKESEMEALNIPATVQNNSLDTDPGRFNIFHTPERKGFFKTPTVRNIALTAPYMHNGVYDSLSQVLDFYDMGGGLGMGFGSVNQTLPADSLKLSKSEKRAIIAFLQTLTDQNY